MTIELSAIYDSRKSFYGRAKVRTEDNEITLISYSTKVVTINTDTKKVTIHGFYSRTTLRHIKEFLKQNGYKADTKAQIEKDYM
jgi:hypothetical protein